VDDFRSCAEVCERQGFNRQAELFREMADGKAYGFVVSESESGYDRRDTDGQSGDPVAVYLNREQAHAEADRLNLQAFRESNILRECYSGDDTHIDIEAMTDNLDIDEVSARISAILGAEFRMPDVVDPPLPIFPPSATDDQIRAIMELFSVRFFFVSPARLAP
jgi:hypothetical protein